MLVLAGAGRVRTSSWGELALEAGPPSETPVCCAVI